MNNTTHQINETAEGFEVLEFVNGQLNAFSDAMPSKAIALRLLDAINRGHDIHEASEAFYEEYRELEPGDLPHDFSE